jgi:hypothetical protein
VDFYFEGVAHMSISVEQREAILRNVFDASKADADLRIRIEKDFFLNDGIHETRAAWEGLLAKCDEKIAQEGQTLIKGIEMDVASGEHLSARRRHSPNAEGFSRVSGGVPSSVDERINAWLDEIGVRGHGRVAALTPLQRETLARMASRNRRIARNLILSDRIPEYAQVGPILDNVRKLMWHGFHHWPVFFSETSLFSMRPANIIGTLPMLHAAARYAPQAKHLGPGRFRVMHHYNDVPWNEIPRKVSTRLQKQLEPYLDGTPASFDNLVRHVMVDVEMRGDLIVEVTYVGRDRTAFAPPTKMKDPVYYVRRQLLGYQLMAIAKKSGARGVEIVLYGNNSLSGDWANRMSKVAREMGVGFVVRHMDVRYDRLKLLVGNLPARKDNGEKLAGYVMPALRFPKRHSMHLEERRAATSPPAEASAAPQPAGDTFEQVVNRASGSGEEGASWSAAVSGIRPTSNYPASVREVKRDLLNGSSKVEAEDGLRRLHTAVWDEIEEQFSIQDELAGSVEQVEEAIGSFVASDDIETLSQLQSAKRDVGVLRERLSKLKSQYEDLLDVWDLVERLSSLVHPDHVDDVLGGSASSITETFGEGYLELEEKLDDIGKKLDARETDLKTKAADVKHNMLVRRAKTLFLGARRYVDRVLGVLREARDEANAYYGPLRKLPTSTLDERKAFFEAIAQPSSVSYVNDSGSGFIKKLEGIRSELTTARDSFPEDDVRWSELDELAGVVTGLKDLVSGVEGDRQDYNEWLKGQRSNLSRKAKGLESSLEVPVDAPLPEPFDVFSDMVHEDSGDKRTLKFSGISRYSSRRKVYDRVLNLFRGSSVLVVEDTAYLIDQQTYGRVKQWRGSRGYDLVGNDLLGNRYELPANSWGVRPVELDDVDEAHPLRRVVALVECVGASKLIGPRARDFFLTIADHAGAEGVGEIWRLLVSSFINDDETIQDMPDGELGYRAVGKFSFAALSLYDRIVANQTLEKHVERWFSWGDVRADHDDIIPLSGVMDASIDDMSIDDMTAAIERMGILPKSKAGVQEWIDIWKKGMRMNLKAQAKSRVKRTKTWAQRELKRLNSLPRPYLLVNVLTSRAGYRWAMENRFKYLEDKAKRDLGAAHKWDDLEKSRFAMRFLLEHQDIISKNVSEIDIDFDEVDVNNSPLDVVYEDLLGKPEFQDYEGEYLASLGQEYLEQRFPSEIAAGFHKIVHLLTGRLVEFGDSFFMADHMSELKEVSSRLQKHPVPPELFDFIPSNDDPSDVSLVENLIMHWDRCKGLLKLRALKTEALVKFRAQSQVFVSGGKYRKGNGGGDGENGGTGSGPSNGVPSNGTPGTPTNAPHQTLGLGASRLWGTAGLKVQAIPPTLIKGLCTTWIGKGLTR